MTFNNENLLGKNEEPYGKEVKFFTSFFNLSGIVWTKVDDGFFGD